MTLIPYCPFGGCASQFIHGHGTDTQYRPSPGVDVSDLGCGISGCHWQSPHKHLDDDQFSVGIEVMAFHSMARRQQDSKSLWVKEAAKRWRWRDGSIWSHLTLIDPEPRYQQFGHVTVNNGPIEPYVPPAPVQGQFAFVGKTTCGHPVSHEPHSGCLGLLYAVEDKMVPLDQVHERPGFDSRISPHLVPEQPKAHAPEPFMSDFDEDTTSVRGPGWGTRTCRHCDHETFGGLESVTEEEMWEHFDECPVLHPHLAEPDLPIPGSFERARYDAFAAGLKGNIWAERETTNAQIFDQYTRWRESLL